MCIIIIIQWIHKYHLILNEVDCQKASMKGAHSCGDLVGVYTSHTPERSPTATVAKRGYYNHHHHYYD
jgi:hypothetical protein